MQCEVGVVKGGREGEVQCKGGGEGGREGGKRCSVRVEERVGEGERVRCSVRVEERVGERERVRCSVRVEERVGERERVRCSVKVKDSVIGHQVPTESSCWVGALACGDCTGEPCCLACIAAPKRATASPR